MSRCVRSAGVAVLLAAPALCAAQGLSIEHQPAGCIVAGRRTTLRACFTPAADVAAARLHYRAEAGGSWSQVAMRSDGGCHEGVVPAFPRDRAGRTIPYFFEGVDRASASHRTPQYAPVVVARAVDCAQRDEIAPVSGRGAPRAVIIGGVAAAGIAVGIATAGDSAAPATTTPVPPTFGPPVRESPLPPPTTTPPGTSLSLACQAAPRSGPAPLRVEFAAFPSGGTGVYAYEWSFGDGETSSNPNPAHTYGAAGRYDAVVRVASGGENAACTRDVTVTAAPAPGPAPSPVPSPTPPPTPHPPTPSPTRTLTVTTTGSNFPGTVTTDPPGIVCNSFPQPGDVCVMAFPLGASVTVTGTTIIIGNVTISGACGASGMGTASCVVVMDANKSVNVFIFRSSAQGKEGTGALTSDLQAPGAEGRVAVDAGPGLAMRAGRALVGADVRAGAHRVEATVDRAGRPGTWGFDLAFLPGFRPGSLRVIAGSAALITPDAVVFRLEGKAGERVAFTFEVE